LQRQGPRIPVAARWARAFHHRFCIGGLVASKSPFNGQKGEHSTEMCTIEGDNIMAMPRGQRLRSTHPVDRRFNFQPIVYLLRWSIIYDPAQTITRIRGGDD
jgi:hypothetical protein